MTYDWNCKRCNKNIWKLYDEGYKNGLPTLFMKCLGCDDVKELVYEEVD